MNVTQTLLAATTSMAFAVSSVLVSAAPASAATPADDRAYVAKNDGTVAVYDTTDNSLVTTISDPAIAAPTAIAVSPDGSEVYVPDYLNNSTQVIDTSSNTVVDTIPGTGSTALDVAFAPDGATAYVSVDQGGVDVIDTATRTVTASIPVTSARNLVVTPDGSTLYVASFGLGAVLAIDIASETVTHTFSGMLNTGDLAISPDGSEVYVPALANDRVNVIDTATNVVVGSVPVSGAFAAAVAPDGERVYVSSSDDTVKVVDTTTRTVVASIAGVAWADGVAVSSDGATVYAASADSDTLAVVDAATNTVTETVTSTGALRVALGPAGPPPEADLAVTLDASAGLLGSSIDYSVTLENNGPVDATAATAQVSLPPATSTVTGLPTGCTYASGTDTVTCDVGAIADGSDTTRSFRANLGLLSLGPLPATATRTASTPTDPNAANDSASADCTAVTGLIIVC